MRHLPASVPIQEESYGGAIVFPWPRARECSGMRLHNYRSKPPAARDCRYQPEISERLSISPSVVNGNYSQRLSSYCCVSAGRWPPYEAYRGALAIESRAHCLRNLFHGSPRGDVDETAGVNLKAAWSFRAESVSVAVCIRYLLRSVAPLAQNFGPSSETRYSCPPPLPSLHLRHLQVSISRLCLQAHTNVPEIRTLKPRILCFWPMVVSKRQSISNNNCVPVVKLNIHAVGHVSGDRFNIADSPRP